MLTTTRVTLEPHASQVRVARHHLGVACNGMQRDLVEVAMLLMSELVTNAIRHGKGAVRLAIKKFPSRLCVEVSDTGSGRPVTRSPRTDGADGRGLILIERLASEWGVTPSKDHAAKTVWFTLRRG
jgi:anti-sigma regulatory factor (Ser/Thr protein kinase)